MEGHELDLRPGHSGRPPARLGRLVGRGPERRRLGELVDSLDTAGGAIMLVGEVGVGKTALLEHLAAWPRDARAAG